MQPITRLLGGDFVTLTEAQLAEHTHDIRQSNLPNLQLGSGTASMATSGWGAFSGDDTPVRYILTNSGENAPHNNLPAYQNVYVWKRIS